jgi:hypothetical protein
MSTAAAMTRHSLYSLFKKHSKGHVMRMDCGCFVKLITAHAGMRNLCPVDTGDCGEGHHVGVSFVVMDTLAKVALVPYLSYLSLTFTPGSPGAQKRGCICPPVPPTPHGVYTLRACCLQHGSRFGCDDDDEAIERNTLKRVLRDEPPLTSD